MCASSARLGQIRPCPTELTGFAIYWFRTYLHGKHLTRNQP